MARLPFMQEWTETDLPAIADILALECAVWEAMLTGDPQADGRMLSSDFLGVYPSGYSNRAEHMAALDGGPVITGYRLDQERLLPAGPGHVLLVYRAHFNEPGQDREKAMYVTSLWRREEAGWINSFSMDTPLGAGGH